MVLPYAVLSGAMVVPGHTTAVDLRAADQVLRRPRSVSAYGCVRICPRMRSIVLCDRRGTNGAFGYAQTCSSRASSSLPSAISPTACAYYEPPTVLRGPYALSGTDRAYAATRPT
eukprot:383290-Rhodomonas_salina.1